MPFDRQSHPIAVLGEVRRTLALALIATPNAFWNAAAIEAVAPEMLEFPFNPDKKTLDFLRGIRPMLWLGAWIKFWRARFGKRVNRVQWKRSPA